jgi:hypothetical protein
LVSSNSSIIVKNKSLTYHYSVLQQTTQ